MPLIFPFVNFQGNYLRNYCCFRISQSFNSNFISKYFKFNFILENYRSKEAGHLQAFLEPSELFEISRQNWELQ